MPYGYKMALAVLTPQFFIVTHIYQESLITRQCEISCTSSKTQWNDRRTLFFLNQKRIHLKGWDQRLAHSRCLMDAKEAEQCREHGLLKVITPGFQWALPLNVLGVLTTTGACLFFLHGETNPFLAERYWGLMEVNRFPGLGGLCSSST